MNIHIHRRLIVWPLALALVLAVAFGLWWLLFHQPKTDIRMQTPGVEDFSRGSTTGSNLAANDGELKTTSQVSYESPVRTTESPTTNAVNIRWKQYGPTDGAELQVRVLQNDTWTDWTDVHSDDRKDGVPAEDHFGLVLTSNAKAVQYRFTLNGNGRAVSVAKPELALIDSTRGPDPTKKSGLARLFGGTAKADAQGPRIYSRAEWGSPDPNGTLFPTSSYCRDAQNNPKFVDRWSPNYWNPLRRVMVHHTASLNFDGNGAAAVRAVWMGHACGNAWGDIGYNYLVDRSGNIFQGRYYNQSQADQFGEVEGGHTYGFNDYSVGIATLGDFTKQGGTTSMVYGVSQIAAWKMYKYNLQPWNQYTDEVGRVQYRIGGHRNYTSTACPGDNMYVNLNAIRDLATSYVNGFRKADEYQYSFQGQGVNGSPGTAVTLKTGQTATAYLDLKNEGEVAWSNTGANPVRLGTWNPRDRGSGFRHAGWISPARPATFTGTVSGGTVTPTDTVEPGETARFEFTFQNQGVAPGTYREYFQPLSEGYTWFANDAGINWQFTVPADVYSYQWMGQTYGQPTEPGTTATLQLDAKNTGNVDWKNTGANPVRLGTYRPRDRASNFYDGSWVNSIRPATFAGQVNAGTLDSGDGTVEPGNTARFVFTFKAPLRPAVGKEYFNLVAEGRAWMNDVGISWPLNTPAGGYGAQFAGQSAAPTISKSGGGIGSMYFDFRNTGTYPWRKSTGIVKLAPNRPNDHVSPFRASGLTGGQLPANTANWLSGTRVGTFAGQVNTGTLDTGDAVIEPGEVGRFYVALDARNVNPGTYREYVNLVAEFFAWMPDIGVNLPVTVTP